MVDDEELLRAGFQPPQYPTPQYPTEPQEIFKSEDVNKNKDIRKEYIEDSNRKLNDIEIKMIDARRREKTAKWCILGFIVGMLIIGGIIYYTAKEGYWQDTIGLVCGNTTCEGTNSYCSNVCNATTLCEKQVCNATVYCGDCILNPSP